MISSSLSSKTLVELTQTKDFCGICLDEKTTRQKVALACRHIFCAECVSDWIEVGEHANCPLCRKVVPSVSEKSSKNDLQALTTENIALSIFGHNSKGHLVLLDSGGPNSPKRVQSSRGVIAAAEQSKFNRRIQGSFYKS